jgi:diguanylate cyclase (GGDEF)-like protein
MTIQEKQKILVVDDERLNRKVLTELLSAKYHIIVSKSGDQAMERIQKNPDIDLVLLDVMMPEMNGYEVIKHLKDKDKTKDIPVIFITALDSNEDEEKGLHLGAADYITKPFNPAIVRLRVENHLRFVRQRKILEKLAGLDGLTEIPNRRSFDDALIKEWNRLSRNGLPLSLAMVDVDYFKLFNDNYGHAQGDQVLKSVANLLNWGMRRTTDLAARYGGEEFVLLFPETSSDDAKQRVEKIRESIEALKIYHEYSTAAPFVTVSIGGATAVDRQILPATLIETADAMLYKAKKSGRNSVIWKNSM